MQTQSRTRQHTVYRLTSNLTPVLDCASSGNCPPYFYHITSSFKPPPASAIRRYHYHYNRYRLRLPFVVFRRLVAIFPTICFLPASSSSHATFDILLPFHRYFLPTSSRVFFLFFMAWLPQRRGIPESPFLSACIFREKISYSYFCRFKSFILPFFSFSLSHFVRYSASFCLETAYPLSHLLFMVKLCLLSLYNDCSRSKQIYSRQVEWVSSQDIKYTCFFALCISRDFEIMIILTVKLKFRTSEIYIYICIRISKSGQSHRDGDEFSWEREKWRHQVKKVEEKKKRAKGWEALRGKLMRLHA